MLSGRLRRKSASVVLDTQTVTSGAGGTVPDRRRGFATGQLGSIADGTSNIYGGGAITEFYWNENGGLGAQYILSITGAANSGWTQVTIDGSKVLTRASASFFLGAWTWSTADAAGAQAFGVGGSSHTCVFS